MSGAPEHLVKSYDQDEAVALLVARWASWTSLHWPPMHLATRRRRRHPRGGGGPKVDALEREIETFVIRLLALRQPVAGDLRHIVAALKIAVIWSGSATTPRTLPSARSCSRSSAALFAGRSRPWRAWCRDS
jgi:hypothetical protein